MLERWQDCQRTLWNAAHAQRMERLQRLGYDTKRDKRWLGAFDQQLELTECRQEFEWLRDVPVAAQQNMLVQLDRAWKRFFDKQSGLPRFKSKVRNDWTPMGVPAAKCVRLGRHRVRFPKLGDLKLRGHRGIKGRPVRVSITREIDQWFVSITCEIQETIPAVPQGAPVGLDLGVVNVLADSDGVLKENPRLREALQKRLARAQRVMARRKPKRGQKPSNNYRKAAKRVAKLYQKIRRQRADLLHNLSYDYAKNHGTVVIEDLRVSNMTKSAKGSKESPGRNVRAKAGLNRSILGVGWFEFRRQLGYKCEREGSTLLVVNPQYTSQECSVCGVVDINNRQTQAAFVCQHCGAEKHADTNAAINILNRGLGAGTPPVKACGGHAVRQPVKQEGKCVSAPQPVLLRAS